MSSQGNMDAVIISMPWSILLQPSIQLGLLTSILKRERFSVMPLHLNLLFYDYFASRLGSDDFNMTRYSHIASREASGLGEWIFLVEPYHTLTPSEDRSFLGLSRQSIVAGFRGSNIDLDGLLATAGYLKDNVPAFLDLCISHVMSYQPSIVGFSVSFSQRIPSLVLAKLLKQSNPHIKIVFGGMNCRGAMGPALIRSFPWIDAVVCDSAEASAPALFKALLSGDTAFSFPGVCTRFNGAVNISGEDPESYLPIDEIPLPDHSEYFVQRRQLNSIDASDRERIPYESSRGCWWGEKCKCTFCGDRGVTLKYRSRTPENVINDLVSLTERYKILDIYFVDNIINTSYIDSVFPQLKAMGLDLNFFFETRPTLTKEQLDILSRSGLRTIQTGIESLSTSILKIMKKGTSALSNIRFMKRCAQYNIRVLWNFLCGFPGEEPDEYFRMADLMLSLTHLFPPSGICHRFHLDRFSAFLENHQAFGLNNVRPARFYKYLFPVAPGDLQDLAYFFDFEYGDGRNPEDYLENCRAVIEKWIVDFPLNYRGLTYRRGPDFLEIKDRRTSTTITPKTYYLDDLESKIYMACDSGATPANIYLRLDEMDQGRTDMKKIYETLQLFTLHKLAFEENDTYLSLALPEI